MRKFNLIWIMAFLLFMPMAFADNYFMLISSDDTELPDISYRCDGSPECYLEEIEEGLYLLTTDLTDDYETQRGQLMWAMFGQNNPTSAGSFASPFFGQLVWNNTYFTNISAIATPDSRDWDKYATYGAASAISNNDGTSMKFHFDDTTTNYNQTMWCSVHSTGQPAQAMFYDGSTFYCCYTTSATGNCGDYGEEATTGDRDNMDYARIITGKGDSDNNANTIVLHKGNVTLERSANEATGGWPWIYMTFGFQGDGIYLGAMDDPANIPAMTQASGVLFLNAIDNYTAKGYEQTDIINFSYSMTNGTTTLSGTADGDIAIIVDVEGLWNISVWKDAPDVYTNRTYENWNTADELTAYLYQTHQHSEDCYSCAYNSTQLSSSSATPDWESTTLSIQGNSAPTLRAMVGVNLTGLTNLTELNAATFWWYKYGESTGKSFQFRYNHQPAGAATDVCWPPLDFGITIWSNKNEQCNWVTLDTTSDDTSPQWISHNILTPMTNGGVNTLTRAFEYKQSSEGGSADTESFYSVYYTANTTLRPYVQANYTSNFTIEVFDDVTGDPITTTDITINISNGAWSRTDTLSGTNTMTYPFDEGIYDISIIVEGVEQTHSSYDLSTESNLLIEEFTFYFNMTNCSTSETNIALNFTILDEENDSLIISAVTTDFELTTDFYTTTADFDLTGQNNYTFCLDPDDIDVTLNGFIDYRAEDEVEYPYARRYWFTDHTIRGDTTESALLYLLPGDVSEVVTFIVTLDGQAIDGTIWVNRFMGTNYELVAMVDIQGGASNQVDLRTVDTFYIFYVYDSNNVLLGTFGPMTISDTVTLNTFTSQSFDTSWYNYLQLRDYQYTFTYDNATNVSQLWYQHSSGLSTEDCLRVVYSEFLNDEQVCYTCSSSASAVLQCLITDTDATYTLQYVTLLNGTWFIRAAEQLSLKETLADNIGDDGLLFAFLLIGILAFVGLFNPAAAVWFAMGGLIFVTLLGLINLSITALVGLLFVGGLIAVKLRT